ncbi:MAG: cysteine hydrolase [Actinomycetota bacterium]
MAVPLADLVDPRRAALVTQECQNGVIGEHAVFPALAEIARREMIPNAARLVKAARATGVPVVHCLALRRPDGLGSNTNARIFGAAKKSPVILEPGSDAARVVDEIGVEEADIVLSRYHGVGPMAGTDLDSVLRNLGATTIVGIGVSVNVGMTNFTMDAVNLGYQFVLPRDAVAGVPEEYADALIDNTLSLLATVVTTDDLIGAWSR